MLGGRQYQYGVTKLQAHLDPKRPLVVISGHDSHVDMSQLTMCQTIHVHIHTYRVFHS